MDESQILVVAPFYTYGKAFRILMTSFWSFKIFYGNEPLARGGLYSMEM